MNVIGISGSLRKGSFNTAALRAAQGLAPEGMTIERAEIGDLPLYNDDVRAAGFPPPAERLRAQLAAAGVAPCTRAFATHHDAWQNAILHDGCVGLTVRSAIHSSHRGLHLLAVEPRTTFPLDLLWRDRRDERPRPAIAAVAAIAAEVTEREGWLAP